MTRYVGRRRGDYTAVGIRRVACTRCGHPHSHASFTICANGRRRVPLCKACDRDLNEVVLRWLGLDDDHVAELMSRYDGA